MQFEMSPCTEDDAAFIEEQADRAFYAVAPPGETAEETLVLKVTDEAENCLGGCILAVDDRNTAAIYDLWVEGPYRRRGIASALIREAEREARARGCYLVMVGTFDFQAKPLYIRLGYALNDTMSGVPKGHEHYFLTKRLDCPCGENAPAYPPQYAIRRGDERDARILRDRLRAYDDACAPRGHGYIPLGKKVTDGSGRIIAGFVGGVDGWNGTDLDALWVDEAYRRQGIGSRLLSAYEREAKESGAEAVFIEAFDWNVGFFRKNGYDKLTGVLEDYPKGHTLYCLQKPL